MKPRTDLEPNPALSPYYVRIRHRRHTKRHGGHGVRNIMLGSFATTFLFVALLCGSLTAIATAAYMYVSSLVPQNITLTPIQVDQSTKIYDRYGDLLFELFDDQNGRRTVVSPEDIPTVLKEATIATEDPTFYDNPGVDIEALPARFIICIAKGVRASAVPPSPSRL